MLDIHIDHLTNARNVGKIKKADLVLETKSSQCEDFIKMYFKLDNKGNIVDVKYQVFGCWAVIVSCSMISEYIKNKNIKEVKNISDEELLKVFEYVPEIKERCFFLVKKIFEQL